MKATNCGCALILVMYSVIVTSLPAFAYEISTHALITKRAYQQSVLNPNATHSIVPVLGFDRLDGEQPFAFLAIPHTTGYYDDQAVVAPADAIPPDDPLSSALRYPQNQERRVLDALVASGYVSGANGHAIEQRVASWLMRGAVREDDNDLRIAGIWFEGGDRDSDPYGRLFRALRHFYDPIRNRAAESGNLCAQYGCVKSIVWALGRTTPLEPAQSVDNIGRRNHFTW